MKRIFYYSGYQLSIFHWQKGQCLASYVFNPDEQGLEKFKTYLQGTDNTPVRILVDLIEEDFNKETIPHVSSADRKSIVQRLIDRHYRKSHDYVHYNVISRNTTGRRDDVILYNVLSNPAILEPWLKAMHSCGTAISGIWSLPLLSEGLIKKIAPSTANCLLVSQQTPSNLRQTFIKNNSLETSRSTMVNLEDTKIGAFISHEVEQTVRFLSNQRNIGFDEHIDIYIICRSIDLENIKTHCINSALRTFHCHIITEIELLLGCNKQAHNSSKNISTNSDNHSDKPISDEYCNHFFSYLCSAQVIPKGHYGGHALFSVFYQKLASRFLVFGSILILLISSLFAFSYLSESKSLDQQSLTLVQQSKSINHEYQNKLANIQHKLNQSEMMQSAVLLTQAIQKSEVISPQKFMSDISRIFSRSGMNDTQISQISWRLNQSEKLLKNDLSQALPNIDYGNSLSINQLATIKGYIRVSQSSLKQSVDSVNSIVDAFKNNKQFIDIKIIRLPVDIRSNSSLENETRAEKDSASKMDHVKGQFEFKILMSGRHHDI